MKLKSDLCAVDCGNFAAFMKRRGGKKEERQRTSLSSSFEPTIFSSLSLSFSLSLFLSLSLSFSPFLSLSLFLSPSLYFGGPNLLFKPLFSSFRPLVLLDSVSSVPVLQW